MTTQVTFTTDEELKQAALEKAKNDGIPLKTFLNFCLKGYLEGRFQLDIIQNPHLDFQTWKENLPEMEIDQEQSISITKAKREARSKKQVVLKSNDQKTASEILGIQ